MLVYIDIMSKEWLLSFEHLCYARYCGKIFNNLKNREKYPKLKGPVISRSSPGWWV